MRVSSIKMIRRMILSMIIILSVGTFFCKNNTSEAAVSKQVDEYKSTVATYVRDTMNHMLIAMFSGSNGTKASVKTFNSGQYKSKITFVFKNAKLGNITAKELFDYITEAIYDEPNLCTLSTDITYREYKDRREVEVKSILGKNEHASAVRGYKEFLADVETLPYKSRAEMTEAELLLYLHDRVVQQADYARDLNDKSVYVPFTMSKSGIVVCQSYAAVYNQLLRDFGFTCHVLTSDTHAWNAVKLGGKWYMVDVTWDDSNSRVYESNLHTFFLVPYSSVKDASHTLDTLAAKRYPNITSKTGNEYDNYLPKKKKIRTSISYNGSEWFYANAGVTYRWDGRSTSAEAEEEVTQDSSRCIAEAGGKIYMGGKDGIYVYDANSRSFSETVYTGAVSGLYYHGGALYRKESGSWTKFLKSTSALGYETINGAADLEKVSLKKPATPVIKAIKSSKKSIRVRVTGAAVNANAGYQVQYSTTSSFNSKKTLTFSGTSKSITGLAAGKKYYVRVRGIWKSGYLKKFGAWSVVKKV